MGWRDAGEDGGGDGDGEMEMEMEMEMGDGDGDQGGSKGGEAEVVWN